MRRRDILAGVASVGAVGAGAWYVTRSDSSQPVSQVAVETLDAAGSTAGTLQVPMAGRVTVLDLFSVTCAPCKTELHRLSDVRSELGSDVQLVSVTNDAIGGTLTRGDIRQWWRRNDGDWPVGLDDGGQLMSELDVTGLPTLAVIDPKRRLVWKHAGLVSTGDLLDVVNGVTR